jgi:hypothetical protein
LSLAWVGNSTGVYKKLRDWQKGHQRRRIGGLFQQYSSLPKKLKVDDIQFIGKTAGLSSS